MHFNAPFLLALLGGWSFWPPFEVARLEQERSHLDQQIASFPPKRPFEASPAVGFHSKWVKTADSALSVAIDFGAEAPLDEVYIVPAFPSAGWGYGFPARYRVELASEETFKNPVVLLDRTQRDYPVPNGPLKIPANGAKGRWLRFTATKLSRQPNWDQGYMFCLGEILAYSGGRNVALRSHVDSANSSRANIPTWTAENLVDGITALGLPVIPDSNPGEQLRIGWHSLEAAEADTPKWVQIDLGNEVPIEEIRVVPANPATFTNRPGFGFPVRFKIELSNTPDFEKPVMAVDQQTRDFPNPGDHIVAWPVGNLKARYVRFTATRLFLRWNDYVFSLAEMEVISGRKNVAFGAKVTCPEVTPNRTFQPEYLVDGRASSGTLVDQREWLSSLARRVELEQMLEGVKRQEDLARIKANERWITLGWFAGAAILAGGVAFVWRGKRQRARELQELRSQIARDLHDEIGSSLGSIALISELGKQDGDANCLEEVHQLAVEAADSMRGILWMIRDGKAPTLEQLEKALRAQGELALRGLEHHFESEGKLPAVEMSLSFHRNLFLLFKEALHNAARHAKATVVSVNVIWSQKSVRFSIRDNGCGFEVESRFSGSGLANMRHRAKAIGARIEFQSAPGKGTQIELDVPLI